MVFQLVLYFFSACALAIVGPSEATSDAHAEMAQPFAAVGTVGGVGTGTLIDDDWVVTAAHVADALRLQKRTPIVFALDDGREFTVDRVEIHPDWTPLEQQMANRGKDDLFSPGDVALLHLVEVVGSVEPITLGAFDAAQPEITIVGVGSFVSTTSEGVPPREANRMPRGVKHAGTNRVDRVDAERNELIISFSAPDDETATTHESSAFVGDSGGPVLSQTKDGWTLIGIIGAIDTATDNIGTYGDTTHATSVSAIREWIDATTRD